MKTTLNAAELRKLHVDRWELNTFTAAHGEETVTLSDAFKSTGREFIWRYLTRKANYLSRAQQNDLVAIAAKASGGEALALSKLDLSAPEVVLITRGALEMPIRVVHDEAQILVRAGDYGTNPAQWEANAREAICAIDAERQAADHALLALFAKWESEE